MEIYYTFDFYSDDNESIENAKKQIFKTFEEVGYDLFEDCSFEDMIELYKDQKTNIDISSRDYLDNEEEIQNIANKADVCILYNKTTDDDYLGWRAILIDKLGNIKEEINGFLMESMDEYEEKIEQLRKKYVQVDSISIENTISDLPESNDFHMNVSDKDWRIKNNISFIENGIEKLKVLVLSRMKNGNIYGHSYTYSSYFLNAEKGDIIHLNEGEKEPWVAIFKTKIVSID